MADALHVFIKKRIFDKGNIVFRWFLPNYGIINSIACDGKNLLLTKNVKYGQLSMWPLKPQYSPLSKTC